MDGTQFDTLVRTFTTTGPRRSVVATALGGALGLLGLALPVDTEAGGKCKPACTECATCKKGKCRKTKHGKVCKRGKCHAKDAGTACSVGSCQSGNCVAPPPITPAPPTCNDGLKNGSETGVDCGGSCPRCVNGQGCASAHDCASAFCTGGTCQECAAATVCGSDVSGDCRCTRTIGAVNVCTSNRSNLASCPSTPCPSDEVCFHGGSPYCYKRCGAP
jgi:hypothetical protein